MSKVVHLIKRTAREAPETVPLMAVVGAALLVAGIAGIHKIRTSEEIVVDKRHQRPFLNEEDAYDDKTHK